MQHRNLSLAAAGGAIAAVLASAFAAVTASEASTAGVSFEGRTADALRAVERRLDETESAQHALQAAVRRSSNAQPAPDADRRLAAVEAALERLTQERGTTAPPERPESGSSAEADDLEALLSRVLAGEAEAVEDARFWELARTSGALPRVISVLEAAVAERPDDVEARLRLADGYVARLYTVPNGPERGAWASRAEREWREVLARDENNWRARYSLAASLSEWPEAFGRTPEALRQLERLREQQETAAPQPHFAQTYIRLAALYRRVGRGEDAADVLRAGLERHPHDVGLRETAAAAGK